MGRTHTSQLPSTQTSPWLNMARAASPLHCCTMAKRSAHVILHTCSLERWMPLQLQAKGKYLGACVASCIGVCHIISCQLCLLWLQSWVQCDWVVFVCVICAAAWRCCQGWFCSSCHVGAADVLQQLPGRGCSVYSSVRLPRTKLCDCQAHQPLWGSQQGGPEGGIPPGCQGGPHQRLWWHCCLQ